MYEAGVVPLCLGDDHSMVLAELRAAAAVHGPLALVHLDAHADVWEAYYGVEHFHGTVFKRAVEEGLVDSERSVQTGLRGTLYGRDDVDAPRELGFDALYMHELAALGPHAYGERVRARVGDGPAFLSFDIDFVDPAFAPATGTPEVGGPSSVEAMAYLRALTESTSAGWTASRSPAPTTRPAPRRGSRRARATRCCRCWRCARLADEPREMRAAKRRVPYRSGRECLSRTRPARGARASNGAGSG